jgi:hypothetical protein
MKRNWTELKVNFVFVKIKTWSINQLRTWFIEFYTLYTGSVMERGI